jgi:hypothetical protein
MTDSIDPDDPNEDDLTQTDESEQADHDLLVDPETAQGLDILGDPAGEASLWFEQTANGYCSPATLTQIVAEYSDQIILDDGALAELAIDLGFLTVAADGTAEGLTIDETVEVLNTAGVPAHAETGLGVEDLAEALSSDTSIALGIDSGEVWEVTQGGPAEAVEDNSPDHIVLLTGLDLEAGVAYINDTGVDNGAAVAVPIDVLMDAWADSGNSAVVCDQPAPQEQASDAEVTATSGTSCAGVVDELVSGSWMLLPILVQDSWLTPIAA